MGEGACAVLGGGDLQTPAEAGSAFQRVCDVGRVCVCVCMVVGVAE